MGCSYVCDSRKLFPAACVRVGMRRLVLVLLLLPASLCAQAVNWHGVDTNIHKLAPTLRPASVTPREQKAIVAHLER